MLNLKYHIVSLVAVFCALGIGIFVGSNLVGDDILVEQQKQVVTKLEQEFNLLREQNKSTQDELTVFKDTADDYLLYCEQTFPLLVADRLHQKPVAVIELYPSGATEKAIKALNDAGAYVAYTASINWDIEPKWEALLASGEQGPLTAKENYRRLSEEIKGLLLSGKDTPLLQQLRQSGFLTITGQPGQRLGGVVILEGSGKEDRGELVSNFDLLIADAYVKLGVDVVAGESHDTLYSTLAAYKLHYISTVDNIDTPIGMASMIFSLQGKRGHYGIGDTADRLFPELISN